MDPTTTPPSRFYVKDYSEKFGAVEYVVFSSVLVASAGIGVYYGWIGRKKAQTNDEFLTAGKSMPILPVALSLICSFVSAITILGNPPEVYYYGTQYLLIATGFIPITLALAYIYVPVFFRLQLTSAYEYFELRFNRANRMVMSVISVIYLILLMSVWVYAPSLALSQVAGINTYLSTGLTFVVCIFYSSLGGLKAVLWTDALQATLMLVSLAAVVGKGITDVGGIGEVWDIAERNNRVEFFNFDPDPRVRHSFWTGTVGGYLIYAATQSQIQRYLSVPTLQKARLTLFINMIGLILIIVLCFLAGLVIYAKYHMCDPIKTNAVETSDQLLPLFVMETLGDYPGLPGIFVAGITGASLSSVSSALNALSAIITEDYVKKWRPNYKDAQLARISKIVSVVGGILSFAFVFVAELMGDIFPIALTMVGMFLGPTLGLFTLGMVFPWANAWGSLAGLISGIVLVLTISAGSIIDSDSIPDQKLPVSTEGCPFYNETDHIIYPKADVFSSTSWKDAEYSPWVKIISLAPTWYPGLGQLSTIFFGLIFSMVFLRFQNVKPVKREYLNTSILRLYEWGLPSYWIKGWVEPLELNLKENAVESDNNIRV
ncbi:Sodium-coupled monocarboxylate transporter 1 [Folsomia candida]|uniref:Sodium-coupled monocarboxylate transporter 1 n=1 Tax=Folsomia candida TaxID=158441 RepID=A0A226EQQ5_FOLCA|nr:Sodium-coupled monocarboxylate transporter 1 [Folsomia candida]